jgi:AcrR family transcriptional regulator
VSTRLEPAATDVRERILRASYPLYAARGIRDVSLREIQDAAGVTEFELLSEFSTRDDLAIAFLERREREWTIGIVESGARERGVTPEERLLAIFDVFDEWFHRDDYEACTFINVMLEMGTGHPLGRASVTYLDNIRQIVAKLAAEANLRDPAEFSLSWHILMKGSIINAVEGDQSAAMRAKAMARLLIREHRQPIGAYAGPLDSEPSAGDWLEFGDLFGQSA